jgi:hypothetical protein
LPIVFSCYAKPVLAIVTGDGLIAFPALWIGASAGVFQLERQRGIAYIMDTEIKPLSKFAGVIGADIEADVVRLVGIYDVYRACVKLAGDVHGVIISNNWIPACAGMTKWI